MEKGYIVFPTENTEGRHVVTQSLEKLDELPQFLYKAWNGAKTPSPMSYPYETNGSRDGDFYDLARRLLICKVSKRKYCPVLNWLTNTLFPSKGFLIKDITKVVNSAYKKVNEGKADEGITNDNEKKQEDSIIPVNIPSPYKVKNNALYRVETKVKNGELDEREIMVARHVPILKENYITLNVNNYIMS